MKTIFLSPPTFLPTAPPWHQCRQLPSSCMGSSKALNTGEKCRCYEDPIDYWHHTNNWVNISINELFLFFFLIGFLISLISMFLSHTPFARHRHHPQKHTRTPFTVVHFTSLVTVEEKCCPLISTAVTIVLFGLAGGNPCSLDTYDWLCIWVFYLWTFNPTKAAGKKKSFERSIQCSHTLVG